MKFSSVRYLLREGFRNIWQNRFMAIASIGVLISCLLLTGASYLVFVNIESAFDWVYGQNVVVAYAKEGTTNEENQQILEQIRKIDNVSKVEFLSKEEALEKYKDSLPEATYEDLQGEKNPIPDSYIITFKDLSRFDSTLNKIKRISLLESFSYNQDIAEALAKVRHMVFLIGGGIVIMLLLVSLFIIANTIKLTVYNRRLEISIMKSVGATNAFVRIPFILEGIVLGLMSGFIAFGIISVLYQYITDIFNFGIIKGLVSYSSAWGVLLLGFLTIGIFTGALGSAISMGKYLRKDGGISGVI